VPLGDCCDRCVAREVGATAYRAQTPDNTNGIPSTHSTPTKSLNANGKRAMKIKDEGRVEPLVTQKLQGAAIRRGERLANAHQALIQWRIKTRLAFYSPSPFTAEAILPDSILTTLASNARIQSPSDMAVALGTSWAFKDEHGEEVLRVLKEADDSFKIASDTARQQVKEAKKTSGKAAQKDNQASPAATPQHWMPYPVLPASPVPGLPLTGSSYYNVCPFPL